MFSSIVKLGLLLMKNRRSLKKLLIISYISLQKKTIKTGFPDSVLSISKTKTYSSKTTMSNILNRPGLLILERYN
jgi:hypothetical protein